MIQSLSSSWDVPALVLALQNVQAADDDNDVWSGWGSVILVVGVIALGAMLLAIVIWQVFTTAQSKMAAEVIAARDDGYRRLAEESATAQQEIAEEQKRVARELAEVRTRLTAIEKLLSEVG